MEIDSGVPNTGCYIVLEQANGRRHLVSFSETSSLFGALEKAAQLGGSATVSFVTKDESPSDMNATVQSLSNVGASGTNCNNASVSQCPIVDSAALNIQACPRVAASNVRSPFFMQQSSQPYVNVPATAVNVTSQSRGAGQVFVPVSPSIASGQNVARVRFPGIVNVIRTPDGVCRVVPPFSQLVVYPAASGGAPTQVPIAIRSSPIISAGPVLYATRPMPRGVQPSSTQVAVAALPKKPTKPVPSDPELICLSSDDEADHDHESSVSTGTSVGVLSGASEMEANRDDIPLNTASNSDSASTELGENCNYDNSPELFDSFRISCSPNCALDGWAELLRESPQSALEDPCVRRSRNRGSGTTHENSPSLLGSEKRKRSMESDSTTTAASHCDVASKNALNRICSEYDSDDNSDNEQAVSSSLEVETGSSLCRTDDYAFLNEASTSQDNNNMEPLEVVKFQCRSVRFGSYRTSARGSIDCSNRSIRFSVVIQEASTKALSIPDSVDIVLDYPLRRVMYCFNKDLNVIFVEVSVAFAAKVRQRLGICSSLPKQDCEPYFDSSSNALYHKYITLVLTDAGIQERSKFSHIISKASEDRGFDVEQITFKKASELLRCTVPPSLLENHVTNNGPVLKRARLHNGHDEQQPQTAAADAASSTFESNPTSISSHEHKKKTIYARSAIRNRCNNLAERNSAVSKLPAHLFVYHNLAVSVKDLDCLHSGEFLNDVIIDFYLSYVVHDVVPEEQRNKIHLFSSYFWRGLTSKKGHATIPENSLLDQTERMRKAKNRHSAVRTWTKHVDLFSKDFIIIPVNENAHWYIAIICFPYLEKKVEHAAPVAVKFNKSRSSSFENQCPEVSSSSHSTTRRNAESADAEQQQRPSDSEEQAEYEEELRQQELLASESQHDSVLGNENCHHITKQPCIIILDSLLTGTPHYHTVSVLRDYLTVEWCERKGSKRVFDKNTMRGIYPVVPQQDNYTDCGLYILQYVENFFTKMPSVFDVPMKGLENWFPQEIIVNKRTEIKALISQLAVRYKVNKDAFKAAKRKTSS